MRFEPGFPRSRNPEFSALTTALDNYNQNTQMRWFIALLITDIIYWGAIVQVVRTVIRLEHATDDRKVPVPNLLALRQNLSKFVYEPIYLRIRQICIGG